MGVNQFIDQVQESASKLTSLEQMLGKGLNVPYNATSSGSRKIMSNVHQAHSLVLTQAELPYVGTGYENRFGDLSSAIITTPSNMELIANIPKFSYAPLHQYYLILRNLDTNELTYEERVSYKYITEDYGYLYNNSVMDVWAQRTDIIPIIPKGTTLRTSTGYDRYQNKTNGCNINVAYINSDHNMEDSVIISETCSKKLAAPLIRSVQIILNENDIPLNMYGDDSVYKIFPDIGEETKNGILMVYRREKKDESIYTQSVQRLQEMMMSDDKITVKGTVIDINLYCNNPDHISKSTYNQQFYAYYQDRLRMDKEIIDRLGPYISQGLKMDYKLSKLVAMAKDELEGKKYIEKRKFSNLMIEFIVMENRNMGIGDKVVDRYGGKGVVSKIVSDELMPKMANGLTIDMIKNSSTMYNRENAGQIFELEINYISMCILDYIHEHELDMQPELAMEYILKFVKLQSPKQYEAMVQYISCLDGDQLQDFVISILQNTCIHISNDPLSETMTIDKLGELYKAFPWIDKKPLMVPLKDSAGNFRFVPSHRAMIAAPQYYLRLKQFSEEKFSAASLSSTNLKGENSKNKASKNHREPNSNTPIKFGQMESGDLSHIGVEYVVLNLLLHSLSPRARRLVEQIATEDPYNVNVKIDYTSKNRTAEILNTRLKTMGYRLVFSKKFKNLTPIFEIPFITFEEKTGTSLRPNLIDFHDKDFDVDAYYEALDKYENERKHALINFDLIRFD